jgi:hypothetical protein
MIESADRCARVALSPLVEPRVPFRVRGEVRLTGAPPTVAVSIAAPPGKWNARSYDVDPTGGDLRMSRLVERATLIVLPTDPVAAQDGTTRLIDVTVEPGKSSRTDVDLP